MYVRGAEENAKLMPEIYPGWKMIVFCEDTTPTQQLRRLGCEIRRMGKSRKHTGMMWRFLPAWEDGVERVIFRDADSRINVREAAAVQAWIESGKKAHCMHDHPHHLCLPLFGGMWGVKGKLKRFNEFKEHCRMKMRRVDDMKYLQKCVLPQIRDSLLRHADLPCPAHWVQPEPFPPHPPYSGFVGQQYSAGGISVSV
ncbi:MAG: hypothetical protein DRN14_00220 [Thermoplasmata archaeon]|nr:MAG: hypothetical protein DRN14_00220 [Thermoplasmata archaeon]